MIMEKNKWTWKSYIFCCIFFKITDLFITSAGLPPSFWTSVGIKRTQCSCVDLHISKLLYKQTDFGYSGLAAGQVDYFVIL